MKDEFKNMANEGVDTVGNAIINLLPINGMVRNALEFGLDKATDVVFRTTDDDATVELKDHPEIQSLAENLAVIVVGLVDKSILKAIDIPFLDGKNEEMFEAGVLLQLKAVLLQAIEDFLTKK